MSSQKLMVRGIGILAMLLVCHQASVAWGSEGGIAQAKERLELIDKTMQRREGRLIEALRLAELRVPSVHRAAFERTVQRPEIGDVTLVVDGAEVVLDRPIILRGGRPLLPLRDVAAARYVSLLQIPEGTFRLVFPDGVIKEMSATWMDQEPMLTEEQVRDLFSVDTSFDPSGRIVSLRSPKPKAFQTSTMEKSGEELREEERIRAVVALAQQPLEPTGEIPEAARPAVQLRGTVSYAYRNPHVGSPDRSLVTSVSGRVDDFKVRGESTYRDRSGFFKHDYAYLNFDRPEDLFVGLFDQSTSLAPLRGQSERFEGVKVIKTWNPMMATTFLGGETENTVSGPSGSVKYLGRLYEAGQTFAPWEWFRLRSSLLYLENTADVPSQSGTTGFPRDNLVSFTDVTTELFTDWTLSGQMAHATYSPDDVPKDVVKDWNWRVGSVFKKERSTLGAAYEFVGDRYASIGNPAIYQDYKGLNVFGNYRLTNAWSVSSTLLRYRNNVDDDPGDVTQENQALLLSSSYHLPWRHTATLAWNDFLANPSGPDPGSSNRTDLSRLDYSLPFLFDSRLLLDVQHTRVRQPAASDSYSNAAGGSLFKGFRGGSSVYLSQQFNHSNFEAAPDTSTSTTSLNATHQVHRNVSLSLSSTYSRQLEEAAKASDALSGSMGVRYHLSPDTTLTSEYRVDSYDVERERWRWPKHWSIFFLVTQSFHVATPPAFATITGLVVQDLNANGVIDPGEPGIEDVAVYLAQGGQTMTTSQGAFEFSRVVPGWETVSVDQASLPPPLALQATEQTVRVGRRGRAAVFFPAVKAASFQGSVFIDANGDGIFQDAEEPLEGIAVILSTPEQFRRTNSDGSFLFDHLLPGSYTLTLHQEDLPVGYALTSENDVTVTVSTGEELKGMPFAVRLLPEPADSL